MKACFCADGEEQLAVTGRRALGEIDVRVELCFAQQHQLRHQVIKRLDDALTITMMRQLTVKSSDGTVAQELPPELVATTAGATASRLTQDSFGRPTWRKTTTLKMTTAPLAGSCHVKVDVRSRTHTADFPSCSSCPATQHLVSAAFPADTAGLCASHALACAGCL